MLIAFEVPYIYVFDEQNDSHIVSLLVNKPHVTGTDKLWLENLYGKSKPGQLPLPNAKRLDRCANPFHSVLVENVVPGQLHTHTHTVDTGFVVVALFYVFKRPKAAYWTVVGN